MSPCAAALWYAFELYLESPSPLDKLQPAAAAPLPAVAAPPMAAAPPPVACVFSPPPGPLSTITEEHRGRDWDPEAPFGFWTQSASTAAIRRCARLEEIRGYNPCDWSL